MSWVLLIPLSIFCTFIAYWIGTLTSRHIFDTWKFSLAKCLRNWLALCKIWPPRLTIRGYSTVVERPLCMRKVPGSIPGISTFCCPYIIFLVPLSILSCDACCSLYQWSAFCLPPCQSSSVLVLSVHSSFLLCRQLSKYKYQYHQYHLYHYDYCKNTIILKLVMMIT